MSFKIATPRSTLLRDATAEERSQIIALSGAIEFRDIEFALEDGLPHLYHCEHSIVEPWDDHHVGQIVAMVKKNNVVYTSLHAHSCYIQPPIKDGKFVPSGDRMSEDEMIGNARENVQKLKEKVTTAMEIAVENNNYFATGAYDLVTEPKFLKRLVDETGISFLLDIGHAEISAYNSKTDFDEYIRGLPLTAVRQIHLSGITRDAKEYRDTHESLIDLDWRQFADISPLCPDLLYVSIEYYKDSQKLISMLKKLRTYI